MMETKHIPASLIAAAPDLLAACRQALESVYAVCNYYDIQLTLTIEALEEAIAKAEGKGNWI
jgi:hypothetical protein